MEVTDGRESFPAGEPSFDEADDVPAAAQPAKEDEPATASWSELLALAAPERKWIALGCTALLLRLPFSLCAPHFTAEALGAAIAGDRSELKRNVLLLFATGCVNAALDFWNVFLFDFAQARLLRRLRVRLFETMLQQEMAFFDGAVSGWLASRLSADTAEMGSDLTWVFRWSIESVVRITGIVTYMFVRQWQLASVAVAVVPLCTAVNYVYAAFLRKNAAKVQRKLADANACSNEALGAARTVLSCGAERVELRRYAGHVSEHYALVVRQAVAQASFYMLCYSLLVGTCVPSAILWFGGLRVLESTPPSVLIAFMLYQGQLLEYTANLLNSFTSLLKSSGSGGEVFKLLRRRPKTPFNNFCGTPRANDLRKPRRDQGDALELGAPLLGLDVPLAAAPLPPRPIGLVELRHVFFSYATRPRDGAALNGISLVARPGEFTALVGTSGAGKSTVFALVYALYEPHSGSVLLDGVAVGSLPPKWLRARALGIVTQEPVLVSGTVAENILYCRQAARAAFDEAPVSPRDEVAVAVAAAKVTLAHGFIEELPNQYETQVGEGGKNLSGGQKQRIAIARAIAHDPALLLLDEATSALDAKSEATVRKALSAASVGRTTIAIAHRLSSVRRAHRIYVLDRGTVVEAGRHEDLLANDGPYAALVSKQLVDDGA